MLISSKAEHGSGRAHRRQGVLAVELVLILPVLLLILLGIVEFTMLLQARTELLAASREGARVASHGGGDRHEIKVEVEKTVKSVLGCGRLGDACVEVQWHAEDPHAPLEGRDRVRVIVHVPAAHVVPNFLGWVGLSIASRELVADALMNVE
jgi:hypothetical protein